MRHRRNYHKDDNFGASFGNSHSIQQLQAHLTLQRKPIESKTQCMKDLIEAQIQSKKSKTKKHQYPRSRNQYPIRSIRSYISNSLSNLTLTCNPVKHHTEIAYNTHIVQIQIRALQFFETKSAFHSKI